MSLYGRTDSNADIAKAALALGCAYSNEYDVFFVDETEAQLQENKDRGVTGPGYWAYLSYVDADGNTRHKSELIVTLGGADTNANETQLDDAVLADVASNIALNADPVDLSIEIPAGALTDVSIIDPGTTQVGEANEVYTGVASTSANGTGATFTVTRDGSGVVTSVTVDDKGQGYDINDIVTIAGADVGGGNDILLNVDDRELGTGQFSVTAVLDIAGTLIYQWQRRTSTTSRWVNVSGTLDGGIYADWTTDTLELTNPAASFNGYQYRVKVTSTVGSEERISDPATLTTIEV